MRNGQQDGIDGDQWASVGKIPGLLVDRPQSVLAHGGPVGLLLAHGAGAPMDSPFMQAIAAALAARGVGVIRFEFPYMAQRRLTGGKRPPNPQQVLLECWQEVHAQVRPLVAGTLAIGGKSMGGRMASLVADALGVDALVCLGYPFYAAGKPEKPRVAHLQTLRTPTLIVQGERDALGNRDTVEGYDLASTIQVHWLHSGDHDLKPLKKSGIRHDDHLNSAAACVAEFLSRL